MQLTLSKAIMQVPTSVAIMLILRFYCDYVGGTFHQNYVGGSFCCNYVAKIAAKFLLSVLKQPLRDTSDYEKEIKKMYCGHSECFLFGVVNL